MDADKTLIETIKTNIITDEVVPATLLKKKKEFRVNLKTIKTLASFLAIGSSDLLSLNEKKKYQKTVLNAMSRVDYYNEILKKLDYYKQVVKSDRSQEELSINIATAFSQALVGYADPTIVLLVSNRFLSTRDLIKRTVSSIKRDKELSRQKFQNKRV